LAEEPCEASDAAGEKQGSWRPRRVEAVIGGDARVPSISAASVLAKVHRDLLMEEMDKQYPMYGFVAHKGYGTAVHQKAIKRHGVSLQHRRSFAPVAKVLRKRPAMVQPSAVATPTTSSPPNSRANTSVKEVSMESPPKKARESKGRAKKEETDAKLQSAPSDVKQAGLAVIPDASFGIQGA